ncbi:MAG: hypothetical protein ACLFR0_04815 [Alphaproteobacteria bacterium]
MIKAQDYFDQHASDAKECVRTLTIKIEEVKAGDLMFINMGLPVQVRAPQDGYRVEMDNGNSRFFSQDEFKNEIEEYFDDIEVKGEVELPADAKIEAVKKGQEIFTQPWSDTKLGVVGAAEKDGYLVTLPEDGQPRFYSNTDFSATFNASAHGIAPEPQGKFMKCVDDETVKYVVLQKDVTFDFEDGACDIPAGYILVENNDDVDGYTAYSAEAFFELYEDTTPKAPSNDNGLNGPV